MNTAIVITKTEPEVKRKAQKIAKEFGISLSSLLNAYLKQVIRTRKIELVLNETPSEHLKEIFKRAEKNYKKGNYSPKFTNADDAIAYLERQGI